MGNLNPRKIKTMAKTKAKTKDPEATIESLYEAIALVEGGVDVPERDRAFLEKVLDSFEEKEEVPTAAEATRIDAILVKLLEDDLDMDPNGEDEEDLDEDDEDE